MRFVVLAAAVATLVHVGTLAKPLRLCTYNIFNGLDGKQNAGKFKTWIRSQELDVVGFNEVNGYSKQQLEKLAQECGFPNSHLQRGNQGFHLAIMSKYPLEIQSSESLSKLSNGMRHGLLHAVVDVKGIKFHAFVTHATPSWSHKRRQEFMDVLQYMQPYLTKMSFVMGDLNCLSHLDRAAHSHDKVMLKGLLNGCESERNGMLKKFCHESKPSIDYEPMKTFYEAGLLDTGAPKENTAEEASNSQTVPTPANRDKDHRINGRLDYILVSPAVANHVTGDLNARTIKDEATEYISDHFPVVLELTFASTVQEQEL